MHVKIDCDHSTWKKVIKLQNLRLQIGKWIYVFWLGQEPIIKGVSIHKCGVPIEKHQHLRSNTYRTQTCFELHTCNVQHILSGLSLCVWPGISFTTSYSLLLRPGLGGIQLLWDRQTYKLGAKARAPPEVMPNLYRGSYAWNMWHWRGCCRGAWEGCTSGKVAPRKSLLCCGRVGACKFNSSILTSSGLASRLSVGRAQEQLLPHQSLPFWIT